MTVTIADVVARARIRLQDRDPSSYAWPSDVLNEYVGEGLRRLAPVVAYHGETDVTPASGVKEFVLAAIGAGYAELDDVISEFSLPGWSIYGGTLLFESAPDMAFTVRGLLYYDDVGDLPAPLVDAVVLFTCFRALEWMTRRGGAALKRYLTDQGDLEVNELQSLGSMYRGDYFQLREEWGTSSFRRF